MQNNKLFVGNLSFDFSEDHLRETLTELFSKYGTVEKVEIPINRDTGKIKGMAFVTMASDDEAAKAKQELNGVELAVDEGSNNYRAINVDIARPMQPRAPRSFGGGGSSYGGGNGGGRSNYGGGNGGGYNRDR
jgi:cold-inducible RNA-binding protein